MRTYKLCVLLMCVLLVSILTYGMFMYVYTDHMFTPISLYATPNPQAPASAWQAPLVPFVHRVNTPQRARKKDRKFGGFEIDVWVQENQILAAHNEQQAQAKIPLSTIFGAVKHPDQKLWWLDLKQELSEENLQTILESARQNSVPVEHLFFEVNPGPTAQLLKQKFLNLLLTLPSGFDEDGQDTLRRNELNQMALSLWQEYQPCAVVASFGKYAYLQAYFPNMPKAIYYSTTRRPSIKKFLMRRHFQKDTSVKIFMTDEYDWINL